MRRVIFVSSDRSSYSDDVLLHIRSGSHFCQMSNVNKVKPFVGAYLRSFSGHFLNNVARWRLGGSYVEGALP